jgi:anthranilate phosphoribosyltransferase
MLEELIRKVTDNQDLTREEAKEAVRDIMSGEVSEARIAAFLTALKMKGETVDEITGAAEGMRSRALPMHYDGELIEIVGTGGDRSNSFNISTTSAFVIASTGTKVAKHGNRAASSRSGAADVLEALGANLNLGPEAAARMLDEVNMCFFYAPVYHSSMRFVGPVRKQLGIRTIFNVLGPLTNPAHAEMNCIGVFADDMVEPLAHVVQQLGSNQFLVFHGQDGLDEISPSSTTKMCEYRDGEYRMFTFAPEDVGLERGRKEDLVGGDGKENAEITRHILNGERDGVYATRRNAVLLNAGAALYTADRADSIREGVELAARQIDSGAALRTMENFIRLSNELGD